MEKMENETFKEMQDLILKAGVELWTHRLFLAENKLEKKFEVYAKKEKKFVTKFLKENVIKKERLNPQGI